MSEQLGKMSLRRVIRTFIDRCEATYSPSKATSFIDFKTTEIVTKYTDVLKSLEPKIDFFIKRDISGIAPDSVLRTLISFLRGEIAIDPKEFTPEWATKTIDECFFNEIATVIKFRTEGIIRHKSNTYGYCEKNSEGIFFVDTSKTPLDETFEGEWIENDIIDDFCEIVNSIRVATGEFLGKYKPELAKFLTMQKDMWSSKDVQVFHANNVDGGEAQCIDLKLRDREVKILVATINGKERFFTPYMGKDKTVPGTCPKLPRAHLATQMCGSAYEITLSVNLREKLMKMSRRPFLLKDIRTSPVEVKTTPSGTNAKVNAKEGPRTRKPKNRGKKNKSKRDAFSKRNGILA